jgi:hypothetical protein
MEKMSYQESQIVKKTKERKQENRKKGRKHMISERSLALRISARKGQSQLLEKPFSFLIKRTLKNLALACVLIL